MPIDPKDEATKIIRTIPAAPVKMAASVKEKVDAILEFYKNYKQVGVPAGANADTYFIDAITKILDSPQYTVTRLGGKNSLNFFVKNNDDTTELGVVISLGVMTAAAEYATTHVASPFFSTIYGYASSIEPTYNRKLNNIDLADDSKENAVEKITVTVTEKLKCSLADKAKENKAFDEKIHDALRFGQDISSLLTGLSEKNVLWMDLKPANILLDENDRIVIADKKGFISVDSQFLKRPDSKRGANSVSITLGTNTYLSDAFDQQRKDYAFKTRQQAKDAWEKEYRYQLAIVLYSLATGKSGSEVKKNKGVFDFNLSVFNSPKGHALKYVIEKLGNPNPNLRLSLTDAAMLMKLIQLGEKNQQNENVDSEFSTFIKMHPEMKKEELAGLMKTLNVPPSHATHLMKRYEDQHTKSMLELLRQHRGLITYMLNRSDTIRKMDEQLSMPQNQTDPILSLKKLQELAETALRKRDASNWLTVNNKFSSKSSRLAENLYRAIRASSLPAVAQAIKDIKVFEEQYKRDMQEKPSGPLSLPQELEAALLRNPPLPRAKKSIAGFLNSLVRTVSKKVAPMKKSSVSTAVEEENEGVSGKKRMDEKLK